MVLLPAIDLVAGRVVRLSRGDRSKMDVYSDDPVAVARDFAASGATWVHVVDLSAAFGEDERALEVALCIIIFKKLLEHVFLQKLQFTLICCPVTRVQSDQMKIIPDHIGAESVNGRDLCSMDQCHLSL